MESRRPIVVGRALAKTAFWESRAATRERRSETWLSTSSIAWSRLKRRLRASPSMPRAWASATTRSACAKSTAAWAMFTCT